jgi:cell division protein FtsB
MCLIVLGLQVRLWAGEGGLYEISQLEGKVQKLRDANSILEERNSRLDAQVLDLKRGYDAIEELARLDLGMIAKDETFFLVVNK